MSQLVELLRPRTLLWKHLLGQGRWAWRFPANHGVVFGRVVSGRCRFQLPGASERMMGPGDYVLLAAPPEWMLRSLDGEAAPVDLDDVPVLSDFTQSNRRDDHEVRVVGGHFEFNSANSDLLMNFLSPTLHIPNDADESDRLNSVFGLIDAESSGMRPGRQAVLSRLLELVLIELLRAPNVSSGQQRGMLSGMTDPQIGSALQAFHAAIENNWTVASLAAQARMSRSVFSQRFMSLVGQPPMTYAHHWRMAVARDALSKGETSLDEIAVATGYGSTSAFSTAFTRTVGRPPARYARDALVDSGVTRKTQP